MPGPTVLLVDDEPLIRRTLARILRRFASVVHVATDGREALKLCQTHAIDIVMTDVHMPKMNGVELTRSLFKMQYPARVIMITGYNMSGFDQFEFEVEVLVKPIEVTEVVRILNGETTK